MLGKFKLWKDAKGEWRFNLLASNGQVIAVSEGYTTKSAAKNGIRSVRLNAPFASVIETEE
jgi:hypothetical protein